MARNIIFLRSAITFHVGSIHKYLRPQVLQPAFQRCFTPVRRIATTNIVWKVNVQNLMQEESKILSAKESSDQILLTFDDSSEGRAPFLWLRDNCQCPSCYDSTALARNFLIENLNLDTRPTDIQFDGNGLTIIWSDSHVSRYDANWLHLRAFNAKTKDYYLNLADCKKKPWGKGFEIKTFNYDNLMTSRKDLLQWIIALETEGATLIKNTPNDPDAGAKLSDHASANIVTHYGRTSPVYNRTDANNIAFKGIKLGLHIDLPFYLQSPGIILLHTMKQHREKGGDSLISDGLYCAEILRKRHPEAFKALAEKQIYFWDKGQANINSEKDFYKIGKAPIIRLDNDGSILEIKYNNQVRDSFMDMEPSEVNSFYRAMKLFYDILVENSYQYKMEDGDIIILDNLRCMHGRESFEALSDRHLETSYMDWDELRCTRRRLTEELETL